MAACKKNITVEAIVKLFFERVWVHFGIPQSIISDQDSRFLGIFRSSLWSMLDTKLTKSTAFHPQIDGQTEAVGDSAFELRIPPFLGLHLVFNVDCLRPYFPPLLDTFNIAEQLTPTELNPDCMEQVAIDRIMDTQIKRTRQQNIQLYRVVKARQLLHQGKWLTWDQVQ
eukprot:PITA_34349